MKKEVLEDGTEKNVPVYVGKTYYRDIDKTDLVRKPNLLHNKSKRRRLKKMGLI